MEPSRATKHFGSGSKLIIDFTITFLVFPKAVHQKSKPLPGFGVSAKGGLKAAKAPDLKIRKHLDQNLTFFNF